MLYLFGLIIFLFGAAIGSFVMVVANRWNTGLSFWKGRSLCFSCNHELKNKDLFPIFSFLFLKGHCRYCESKIPKETFVAEILMGILTLVAALKAGIFNIQPSVLASTTSIGVIWLLLTIIFGIILLISIYDLKHFIIPDSFLVIFFILSLLYAIIHNTYTIIHLLLSGLGLALPFLLIFLISRGRWLGFGDVKYIAVLGFFLGISQGLSAVILAFWIGAAFALLALSLKKFIHYINLPILHNNLTIKSEVPFGPFLSIGIILSFYFNADLFQIQSLFGAL